MEPLNATPGTALQVFERLLAEARFEGLKALLARLEPQREQLPRVVLEATTYTDLLARLGYRLTITRQIHVQDCYGRLGPEGGIKAVLPYHDISTQRSLPTLVNLDGTVTATPASAAFFEALFLEFKALWQRQPST